MNHDEKDALWDLLGKAKPAKVSPFFSRNVLRAIREEEQERPSVFAVLMRRWSLVATAACVLTVIGFNFVPRLPEAKNDKLGIVQLAREVSGSPDYQVISNLDELLNAEASYVWLENPVY